jgi:hypothetical protein
MLFVSFKPAQTPNGRVGTSHSDNDANNGMADRTSISLLLAPHIRRLNQSAISARLFIGQKLTNDLYDRLLIGH